MVYFAALFLEERCETSVSENDIQPWLFST